MGPLIRTLAGVSEDPAVWAPTFLLGWALGGWRGAAVASAVLLSTSAVLFAIELVLRYRKVPGGTHADEAEADDRG